MRQADLASKTPWAAILASLQRIEAKLDRTEPLAGFTIEEAATMLGISDDLVRKMIAVGELRARKAGTRWVVSRKAVEDWWAADGKQRRQVVELRRR